jgi:hypothetical protein
MSKIRYLTFAKKGDKNVLLFVNQSGRLSGYTSTTPLVGSTVLGIIEVYRGTFFIEDIYVCIIAESIVRKPTDMMYRPVWHGSLLSILEQPVDEVQKIPLEYVFTNTPFKARAMYNDQGKKMLPLEIVPCTLADLPM